MNVPQFGKSYIMGLNQKLFQTQTGQPEDRLKAALHKLGPGTACGPTIPIVSATGPKLLSM